MVCSVGGLLVFLHDHPAPEKNTATASTAGYILVMRSFSHQTSGDGLEYSDRLRDRHLALEEGCRFIASREVGGINNGGPAPSSRSPPEPAGPLLLDERDAAFPQRPSPLELADGGILGPGGQPSFPVFKEP